MADFDYRSASFRTIALGFLGVILLGTGLLMLPFATRGTEPLSLIDCLFTATSATCVTGLVVHDTGTFWSPFGQCVILGLIQIGGMGVLTVALFISKVSGREINLSWRGTMQESISAPKIGGILHLAGFIIRTTLIIEALGALCLWPIFAETAGWGKGLLLAIFHSISAFCNAGFDILGGYSGAYSSLTSFAGHTMLNVIICTLIIVGGLGFLTWDDVRANRWHLNRYTMQSKTILSFTALLLLLPMAYLFIFEWQNIPASERMLASFFQTVTVRTAGFNTVDLTELSDAGIFMMIALMLVGAGPGSTAGGMKVTTLAALLATAIAVYKRDRSPQLFQRRLTEDTVTQALAIVTLYIFLFSVSAVVISKIEGLPLLTCMFETSSAIATVGITLGITTSLSAISKLILIGLMFFGRVGGLTIIYAAVKHDSHNSLHYPQGKLTVG